MALPSFGVNPVAAVNNKKRGMRGIKRCGTVYELMSHSSKVVDDGSSAEARLMLEDKNDENALHLLLSFRNRQRGMRVNNAPKSRLQSDDRAHVDIWLYLRRGRTTGGAGGRAEGS